MTNQQQQSYNSSKIKGRIRTDNSRNVRSSRLALCYVMLFTAPLAQSFHLQQQLQSTSSSSPLQNRHLSSSTALPYVVSPSIGDTFDCTTCGLSTSSPCHLPTRLLPKYQQSSTRKRTNHYFALDYNNLLRSKTSLASSSMAIPASGVNDVSDYDSWISSGWNNMYEPSHTNSLSKQQQQQTSTSTFSQSNEYQRRKDEWAQRYTTLKGLRKAFGSNKNKLWGDLDVKTTRMLYKSLLPNALCELVLELGVLEPEELAPLAYKARKAAKLYARERCRVPARIAANLLDGFRQWKQYGQFQPSGISYEQLWNKYYHQQLEQVIEKHYGDDIDVDIDEYDDVDEIFDDLHLDDIVTEEEIVSQTCQKILEKASTTNEMIDRLVLGNDHHHDPRKQQRNDLLLKRISRTLERDVRKLLFEDDDNDTSTNKRQRSLTPKQYHALKLFARARKNQQRGLNHHEKTKIKTLQAVADTDTR